MFRDELFIPTPTLNNGGLKPIILEVGMFCNDNLKLISEGFNDLEDESKHPPNRFPVFVVQGRKIGFFSHVGREIILSGLVDHQEVRHGAFLLNKPFVQRKQCRQMIPNPVLTTSHFR
jgi:hypothetical protein